MLSELTFVYHGKKREGEVSRFILSSILLYSCSFHERRGTKFRVKMETERKSSVSRRIKENAMIATTKYIYSLISSRNGYAATIVMVRTLDVGTITFEYNIKYKLPQPFRENRRNTSIYLVVATIAIFSVRNINLLTNARYISNMYEKVPLFLTAYS